MTAILDAPAATTDLTWPVTVLGSDPVTGHPGTWHVELDETTGRCRVEWAFGHLTNPAVWMQASKVTEIVAESYARELIARVAR